jgi:hypothetical protein
MTRHFPIFPTRLCSQLSTNGCPCLRLESGKRKLSDIDRSALSGVLEALLGWEGRKSVDRLAPEEFETPAGSAHAIDYEAEGGPTVTVRVQALFGLSDHPAVAGGKAPLVLSLTSHLARRPSDPDDARPSRLLERKLGRGRQGNARTLSEASLAGRPRSGRSDAQDEEGDRSGQMTTNGSRRSG